MSSTNKTTHYELSQYVSSDKPTYLGDYNGDMLKIDTGINAAKTAADTAQSDATAAGTAASTAQTTANTAVTNAATAQSTADGANTKIGTLANLNTNAKTNLVEAINEVNSKVDYSTNEHVIGTWIDGKPLYEKTFIIPETEISSLSTTHIDFNISNTFRIKKYDGTVGVQTSNTEYPIEGYRNSDFGLRWNKGDHLIQFIIGTSLSDEVKITGGNINIYYTKTTD